MENSDLDLIKHLVPFNEKTDAEQQKCLANAKVLEFNKGKMIFKRTEEDANVYWLLSGALDLLDEKFEAKNRKAGDNAARYPIDNYSPHRLTAISTEQTRILVADRANIGLLSPGTTNSNNETLEEEEGIDWMSTLLSSPLFEFIPPANIQLLFSKFEEIKYDLGDVVIRQGEKGDYFYVLQSGRVKVERTAGDKISLLAELKAGDNFGQDALVSDVPRNASVTMLTTGTLMRLSAPDFESLLVNPVLETVSIDEAQEMVQQGEPKTYILDVRSPKEFEDDKLKGSQNVPLLLLINRKNLSKLKKEVIYVTRCDGGKRAELAAFILNENGFTAYVLK